MLNIIRSQDRHFSDMGWLQTYWLFSFSSYHDPENINHGALRVFNDDIVQPESGFGTHPHEEMEIISIVLQGEMVHRDTMGNDSVIRQNDVQRMTAGTGLHHSEWNKRSEPVAFFQIWILPDTRDLQPSYDQKSFTPDSWQNRLCLLASHEPDNHSVKLNTKALLYRASLDREQEVLYEPQGDQYQFVYVIDGELLINNVQAGKRDQVRIHGEQNLCFKAQDTCDFVLIDVPGS